MCSFLGHLGGQFVTECWHQRRHLRMRMFQQVGAAFGVGLKADNAALTKDRVGAFEQAQVAEQRVRHQRQKGVEFELPGLRRRGHRRVLRNRLQG